MKGKRREKGLGSLSTVSLAAAREKTRELRAQIAGGVDPLAEGRSPVTFGTAAMDYIDGRKAHWSNPKSAQQWENTLRTYATAMWNSPVDAVTTDDVLNVLKPIWTEKNVTATRVRGRIERVLDAAKVRGLGEGDNPARWSGHLSLIFPTIKVMARGHHAAMPYADVPAFVAELRTREARSARALEFLILTAARSSEVFNAAWDEFNLEEKLWIVPAERMKARADHRVPLVDRAVDLLEHVRFLAGDRPQPFKMSSNAFANLLSRMDSDEYTVHGFRSSFRDWVGEDTDFPREIAEAALAHQVGNAVERAYRRGDAR
jgi:integrase